MRVAAYDQAAIVRAAFFRGVSAMPNSFAHESFIDELAVEAGVDPVEFRLRNMRDERAMELVRAVAERAGWTQRLGPTREAVGPDVVRGRGFAYAVYVHGPFPGKAAAASAWVVDVEVNKATGEVAVTKVTVGQDSGMMINPDGVRHQIEGNVIQSTSRTLKEAVKFDRQAVTTRDWSTYPILKFTRRRSSTSCCCRGPTIRRSAPASPPRCPAPPPSPMRCSTPPGCGSASCPWTPERVRAGLLAHGPPVSPIRRRAPWIVSGLAAAAAVGAAFFAPARPIAPVAPTSADVFSAATIERGRLAAAAGNCAGCHTTDDGAVNAGGRPLHTPFGVVYTTNLTPDVETGIGAWSYPAFERAMRQGISRDGHHLYPAFPYTAFARMSDADLQALYAYLMAQPAIRASPPRTSLAFPMNIRPLMAGWNALFHQAGPFAPDPSRPSSGTGALIWSRARATARPATARATPSAPRRRARAISPAARSTAGTRRPWARCPPRRSPGRNRPCSTYLRTGASDQHGATAGPMHEVVVALRPLPDSDLRAMAHYLTAEAPSPAGVAAAAARAQALTQAGRASLTPLDGAGARIFDGACAVCHAYDNPDLFGGKVSLPLSSNVNAERPDNLIRVILGGVSYPSKGERGAMPAFDRQFTDAQLTELVTFIRRTQAVGKPAWDDVAGAVRRIRSASGR